MGFFSAKEKDIKSNNENSSSAMETSEFTNTVPNVEEPPKFVSKAKTEKRPLPIGGPSFARTSW
jgi:hypothetical protein